jgi:hypothetical protein
MNDVPVFPIVVMSLFTGFLLCHFLVYNFWHQLAYGPLVSIRGKVILGKNGVKLFRKGVWSWFSDTAPSELEFCLCAVGTIFGLALLVFTAMHDAALPPGGSLLLSVGIGGTLGSVLLVAEQWPNVSELEFLAHLGVGCIIVLVLQLITAISLNLFFAVMLFAAVHSAAALYVTWQISAKLQIKRKKNLFSRHIGLITRSRTTYLDDAKTYGNPTVKFPGEMVPMSLIEKALHPIHMIPRWLIGIWQLVNLVSKLTPKPK